MNNVPWLIAYVQTRIDPPLIPLIKAELEEKHATNIIMVNIFRNHSQAT